ncbi:MAG TPA: hypothetical protein VFM65_03630 [Flavobacteriaceae bacterium]|nr:hypothetical protein [Flavobacteriaceae bacterium]
MKKALILIILAVGVCAHGQILDRKGKLIIKVGTEYRITPFGPPPGAYANVSQHGRYTSPDKQNSGFALNYSLNYFIGQNWGIGLGHSFRYTLHYAEQYHPDDFAIIEAKHALFMDFHLYLYYYFKVFKKAELFAKLGISLFNRNSNFSLKDTYYDANGEVMATSYGITSYNYSPTLFGIGYKKDNVELMLGVYYSQNTPYFNRSYDFYIPFVKLNFDLFRF